MNTAKTRQKIINLIDELARLAPARQMPYIHLGTDEARRPGERVSDDFLGPIFERVRACGRQVVHW